MTSRTIAAESTGPVTIDAALLGHAGIITVRAERDCERATLTISTADEEGDAADAVRQAALRQSVTGGLYASVEGRNGGGTTIVTGGGRNIVQSVVSHNSGSIVQINSGNLTGMTITGSGNFVTNSGGGDIIVNGVRITGNSGTTVIKGSSPIEITAVVPEGSSLTGRTDAADIEALGALLNISGHTQSGSIRAGHVARVTAKTQSGAVVVERAANINANTQSGAIRLGRTDVVEGKTMSGAIIIADFGGSARLKTMSGRIQVHATAGGDITAKTMSGDIDITATKDALDDDLDVLTSTMSGQVRAPQRPMGGNEPRRRR